MKGLMMSSRDKSFGMHTHGVQHLFNQLTNKYHSFLKSDPSQVFILMENQNRAQMVLWYCDHHCHLFHWVADGRITPCLCLLLSVWYQLSKQSKEALVLSAWASIFQAMQLQVFGLLFLPEHCSSTFSPAELSCCRIGLSEGDISLTVLDAS